MTTNGGRSSTMTRLRSRFDPSQDSPSLWRSACSTLLLLPATAALFGGLVMAAGTVALCWWLASLSRDLRCLLSCAVETSRACWRSLAQPRWVLFWLAVASLICSLSLWFMPPAFALDTARAHPAKFLLVKANAVYLLTVVAIWNRSRR